MPIMSKRLNVRTRFVDRALRLHGTGPLGCPVSVTRRNHLSPVLLRVVQMERAALAPCPHKRAFRTEDRLRQVISSRAAAHPHEKRVQCRRQLLGLRADDRPRCLGCILRARPGKMPLPCAEPQHLFIREFEDGTCVG